MPTLRREVATDGTLVSLTVCGFSVCANVRTLHPTWWLVNWHSETWRSRDYVLPGFLARWLEGGG